MIPIGRMTKQVALQKSTRVPDTNGFVETWATYATVRACVEPTTAAQVERSIAATVQTPVSHLVTIWWRDSRAQADAPGSTGKISVADRVLFGTRPLYIMGIQNPMEENRQLVLACEERAT